METPNIWQDFMTSIDEIKLGFIISLVLGYGFYRLLSRNSQRPNTNEVVEDNTMVSLYLSN